jgi:hypothetical protein
VSTRLRQVSSSPAHNTRKHHRTTIKVDAGPPQSIYDSAPPLIWEMKYSPLGGIRKWQLNADRDMSVCMYVWKLYIHSPKSEYIMLQTQNVRKEAVLDTKRKLLFNLRALEEALERLSRVCICIGELLLHGWLLLGSDLHDVLLCMCLEFELLTSESGKKTYTEKEINAKRRKRCVRLGVFEASLAVFTQSTAFLMVISFARRGQRRLPQVNAP